MKTTKEPTLKRELGLAAATAIVVGNMIGSGIFTSPQSLAQVANPKATIIAWIITGAGSVLLALSFANLGTKYPATGGPIIYTHKAFGEFSAFLVGWTFWIGSWVGNAAIVTAIIRYLTPFFPILATNGLMAFLLSSLLLWTFTYINILGVKQAGIVGIVTTVFKLGVILIFMIIAIIGFNPAYLQTTAVPATSTSSAIPAAIAITLWSFVGLESASISGGEIKNPEKNIRRSTVWGTIFAAVIYLFLSILAMGSLPQAELAVSEAPLASIIDHVTGAQWGGLFISLGIVISALGTTSGWILTTARVAYAAGEDRLFPHFFAKLHPKHATPYVALILSSIGTNILFCLNYLGNLTSAFDFMIQLATLSFIPAYAFTTCGELLLLFKKDKDFCLWRFLKHGIFSLLAFVYAIYVIYGAGADTAMWVFILMLVGIPFYVYGRLHHQNS